jgi:ArsR family transcriptional regulator
MHIKVRICASAHKKTATLAGSMSIDATLNKLLGALAHPVRRRALALLSSNEELCVCELMAALGVTQSRMSRHMSTLKTIGVVLERRDAQWVRYRRNPNTPAAIAGIVDLVLDAMPQKRGSPNKKSHRARIREGADL